jgi:two-component system chemotaxis sensor kinase CheA
MQSVFEFIKVPPTVINEFMDDMEYEFDIIGKTQKDDSLSSDEALIKIYQSVHAIKSNAVIIGLSVFANKVHQLETKIKNIRQKEGEIPFSDMLEVAMDIEKIFYEKEGFGEIIEKLQTYTGEPVEEKQHVKIMLESLSKTVSKAAEDNNKTIKFITSDIEDEAFDKCPKRIVKEVLMQLLRNSVAHGIEIPEVREANGKNETGIIKLSIKMSEDKNKVIIRLSDDGSGLDYKKISEKAIANKLVKKEDAENRDMLNKAIFSPGFSTAETEGMHAGRGIGLNLVRDRLKDINGLIKLRSEDGKGIQFLVTIPV